MVDSPDLSPSTPASRLPLGAPASYWLDLRHYNPVEVAASLGKPMLILQGARDYQVTVADDLARWEAGVGDRPNVTIRVYPDHNHLFTPGVARRAPRSTNRPNTSTRRSSRRSRCGWRQSRGASPRRCGAP
jgi:uncharacterized protein